MKRAVIFGAASFAQVAYIYLRDDSEYQVEAFVVDRVHMESATVLGLPVIPYDELPARYPPTGYSMFVGVGYKRVNAGRKAVFERCLADGYTFPAYVHSSVMRWPETTIGDGTFVFENNVIQPFASIGRGCVLWSGNFIGHHTTIGDYVFIASHADISGNCKVGDGAFVGANATLRDGISVGSQCVIGAGALLLGDAASAAVYRGTPTTAQERSSAGLNDL
jgi:sugar O-acyltransferase (sialic acid O-acetyltransferase NeuD family)